MPKYIFVTGGVVSSLGKGLAASSIGCLLEARGLSVTCIKLDPYINVDPGTMSPFQHGEVFVTDDGAETDLDLGHYERFTHAELSQSNNWTTGRIYLSVINKERRGDYLGKTIQDIPHITNEIKDAIRTAADGPDDMIVKKLGVQAAERDLRRWSELVETIKKPDATVSIGIVGKYVELEDSYKSLHEALVHGGIANRLGVQIRWIESEDLMDDQNWEERLRDFDAILVPGGFGKRGISGMLRAINYARREQTPFFGICLGMQCATVEFARNVCGLDGADSTEFDDDTPHPVIFKLRDLIGVEALGGTMRLGAYPCRVQPGSLAEAIYSASDISERHRHRYEFNPRYEDQLGGHGLVFSGKSPDGKFFGIVELTDHPWFLGCQFHPEFKSKPLDPHPLFVSFVKAAYEHRLRDEASNDPQEDTALAREATADDRGWKLNASGSES